MSAPRLASSRAWERPRPPPAPVMTATLPSYPRSATDGPFLPVRRGPGHGSGGPGTGRNPGPDADEEAPERLLIRSSGVCRSARAQQGEKAEHLEVQPDE